MSFADRCGNEVHSMLNLQTETLMERRGRISSYLIVVAIGSNQSWSGCANIAPKKKEDAWASFVYCSLILSTVCRTCLV